MSLSILSDAIEKRAIISFEYNKIGKVKGIRLGAPHAIFIMHKKDGSESTKVHIVQIDGVSDSCQTLPSFRLFDLEELTNIEITYPEIKFEVSEQYNSDWKGYQHTIVKI